MLTHVHRRRLLLAALAGALFAALGVTIASPDAARKASAPVELLKSKKTLGPLKVGALYQASTFPLVIRLKASDSTWLGAQGPAYSHGRPAFGWVIVAHPPVARPAGLIAIETAFGATPSVGATLANLRYGGSNPPEAHVGGVQFGKPSPVKIAGYSGKQFDGEVWGKFGHPFLPFSPHVRGPATPPDANYLHKGEAFRFIVLNVRGKTVVIGLESLGLPPEQFPDFLTSAGKLLHSLTFPD